MRILDKYIASQVLRTFGIIITAVIGIYLIVDFFDEIDDFMEVDITFGQALYVFLSKIPILQFLPVCVLLAVLIVFGLMRKNNELVALRSSGVSVYYLMRAVLVIGFSMSLFMFFVAEFIVPVVRSRGNQIWEEVSGKDRGISAVEKDIWVRGNHSILHISYFDPSKLSIHGISLNYFDDDFKNVRRIDAEKAVFKEGQWVFLNVMEQIWEKESGAHETKYHPEKSMALEFIPDDFKRVARRSEEMGFAELREYIQKVELEGYDATLYRVDLFDKATFPLICIIMCIIGSGIALRGNTKGSIAVSIVLGICTAFLFRVTHGFCVSLGYGGLLHPLLAVTIPQLLFICVGMVILFNSE